MDIFNSNNVGQNNKSIYRGNLGMDKPKDNMFSSKGIIDQFLKLDADE